MFDEPYVHYYDSLTFQPDSALQIYRLIPVEKGDTLFDGIRIDVKVDSLSVADTVAETQMPDTAGVVAEPVGRSAPTLLKMDDSLMKRK